MKSALLCEHANEIPMTCPCEEDCYCKYYSCKSRSNKTEVEAENFTKKTLKETNRNLYYDLAFDLFDNLTYLQLEKILGDDFKNDCKELIQKYLKPKPESINESKLIDDFWELPWKHKYKILQDLLGWSEQKVRNMYEDFGWGLSPIILRGLREKSLLRDFKEELKKYYLCKLIK